MKTLTSAERDLLENSKRAVHLYFERDMKNFADLLADDFIWIGSYNFQYTNRKSDFLKASEKEGKEQPAQISEEEYHLLSHENNLWIVYGCFSASAFDQSGKLLYTHQRLTMVWKKEHNSLKLLHINCTMARDIMLETALPIQEKLLPETRWFDYIRQLEQSRDETPVFIKDIEGENHYLLPSEIFYAHAENKYSMIYTFRQTIHSCHTLQQLLKTVPQLLQVHKSWLINPAYLLRIRRYSITLSRGIEIPVGKSRYNEIIEHLKHNSTSL